MASKRASGAADAAHERTHSAAQLDGANIADADIMEPESKKQRPDEIPDYVGGEHDVAAADTGMPLPDEAQSPPGRMLPPGERFNWPANVSPPPGCLRATPEGKPWWDKTPEHDSDSTKSAQSAPGSVKSAPGSVSSGTFSPLALAQVDDLLARALLAPLAEALRHGRGHLGMPTNGEAMGRPRVLPAFVSD